VTFAALLVASACGARTELLAPEVTDAGHDGGAGDAAHDARVDAAPDGPADAPVDAPPRVHGCADGQREGFVDDVEYAAIAGCAGGWSIPGVMPFKPARHRD